MRYSVAAAILLASTAIATPELAERDGYGKPRTTTVTKTVYVTATPGPKNHHNHHHGKPKPQHKPKKVKTVYATVTSTAGCGKPTPVAPPPTYDTPEPEVTPIAPPPVPTYASEPEPSSPPSYTPPTGDSIPDQCVRAHNEYRAQHGAEPVTWSQRLVDKASSSSYKCVFDHMHGTGFGENLAQGYSTVGKAIEGWYNEKSQYNYGSGGFSMATGHFTQVVWKGTKEIGCVFQEDCSGGPLLRCEYYPPGNYAGEYQANVAE